ETRMFTFNLVNMFFNRGIKATPGTSQASPVNPCEGWFYESIKIPFCCEESGNIIGSGLIENRSVLSVSGFKVINQPTHFELILDNTFSNKDVNVTLFDLSGRLVGVSTYKIQKKQNSILVKKTVNELGMYFLSIRTNDQMITNKVVNY
ncbi:MAG: hypothetical protein ACI86M_002838, partial [Saprospiraceae bacterium]